MLHSDMTRVVLVSIVLVMEGGGALCQVLPSWEHTSLRGTRISSLVFGPNGDLFAGQDLVGIFRSSNDGDSWAQVLRTEDVGGSNITSLAVNIAGHIFAGTSTHGVYRSLDDGNTWDHFGLDSSFVRQILVYELEGREYVIAANGRAMRSHDGGLSWSSLVEVEPSYWVVSMTVTPSGLILVGTEGPLVEPNDGILYVSNDNGDTWRNLGHTGPGWTVEAGPDNSIFVGGAQGLAYSPDADTPNWSFRGPKGIDDLLIFSPDTLFAAKAFDGVIVSADRGVTWSDWLTNTNGASLALSDKGILFAGTTDGVFRTVAPVVTSAQQPYARSEANNGVLLAFPNPFHDTVSLSFNLERQTGVRLRIFTLLGQEAVTLVSGRMPAGKHLVKWDATAWPAGLFFTRLELENSQTSVITQVYKY